MKFAGSALFSVTSLTVTLQGSVEDADGSNVYVIFPSVIGEVYFSLIIYVSPVFNCFGIVYVYVVPVPSAFQTPSLTDLVLSGGMDIVSAESFSLTHVNVISPALSSEMPLRVLTTLM